MKDFEEQLKSIYSKDLEEKKTWYSAVADAYNQTRPPYPAELINRAVKLAGLPPGANLLEIGCGPGTATTAFASKALSLVCLEPCWESYQLGRQNCRPYPNVEILNTTFEEWELERTRFHGVLAASSFHWIGTEIGCPKAADALEEHGRLILLWNTPPQPKDELYPLLNQVYQTHAPSLAPYEEMRTHEENLSRLADLVIDSGYFQDLLSEQLVCEVTYSIDDYLALLSTLSPYIMLSPQQRHSLFAGLKETLERNCGSQIQTSYLSVLQIAKKR